MRSQPRVCRSHRWIRVGPLSQAFGVAGELVDSKVEVRPGGLKDIYEPWTVVAKGVGRGRRAFARE